jgi:hypothetical protein
LKPDTTATRKANPERRILKGEPARTDRPSECRLITNKHTIELHPGGSSKAGGRIGATAMNQFESSPYLLEYLKKCHPLLVEYLDALEWAMDKRGVTDKLYKTGLLCVRTIKKLEP